MPSTSDIIYYLKPDTTQVFYSRQHNKSLYTLDDIFSNEILTIFKHRLMLNIAQIVRQYFIILL